MSIAQRLKIDFLSPFMGGTNVTLLRSFIYLLERGSIDIAPLRG